jgi:hypothetical protein
MKIFHGKRKLLTIKLTNKTIFLKSLLSSRISTYDERRCVLKHRDQLSNIEISSQSKRSFPNNISTLFLTFRILRAPDGLSILVQDQVTFVCHGQTHLAGVRFIPGDRGPHGFPLLGVHNQVVVLLQQNSDSPIVSRVGMPAWRPLVDDKIAVILGLVEIKSQSYYKVSKEPPPFFF